MSKAQAYDPKPNAKPGGSHRRVPEEIVVKRSDPVYNAHAYLTKVPIGAIEPFLDAFTQPGDVVLDMFGGSAMTGVAAAINGRQAEIRDISVLGRHIGTNYLNIVDVETFREAANRVVEDARERLGDVYATACGSCGRTSKLSRTVWTYVFDCPTCGEPVDYYESLYVAEWKKANMLCSSCGDRFSARRAKRIGEKPVLDTVECECSKKLVDQDHTPALNPVEMEDLSYPDVPIGEDRQMFQSSALRKHGLLSTASFFSKRNIAVLAALREGIGRVEEEAIRSKLLFAFTGILTRASKRYQWHPKRPLNAANHNYYIAPVFYEWNVYDLFGRKVEAALRSDKYIQASLDSSEMAELGEVNYEIGSADALNLPNESVDYVFIDPPFGSNIFYSDMNLFQEAWLDCETDHAQEAVVDRTGRGEKRRTAERYEGLIKESLREASRVLRSGGWMSIVFSNSNGKIWGLLQRAVDEAGFALSDVTLLNKGQRSVKGLASGFENVVTADLILSMQKLAEGETVTLRDAPDNAVERIIERVLESENCPTPSHVYLKVIRHYMRNGWKVAAVSVSDVVASLQKAHYEVDRVSGYLVGPEARAA